MSSKIFETRPRWVSVAAIVSEKTGKKYSGVYCREVATGFRSNAKLEPILREMGLLKDPAHSSRAKAVLA